MSRRARRATGHRNPKRHAPRPPHPAQHADARTLHRVRATARRRVELAAGEAVASAAGERFDDRYHRVSLGAERGAGARRRGIRGHHSVGVSETVGEFGIRLAGPTGEHTQSADRLAYRRRLRARRAQVLEF
eukprot:ctg_325.g87